MAKEKSSVNDNVKAAAIDPDRPVGSLVGAIITGVGEAIGKLWHAVTDDGHLAAAGRQGIDELGTALKAFPDAIQVQESGAIFNPTQGEIAAARQSASDGPPHPWPSEIARQNRHQPGNDHGQDYSNDTGHSM